MRDRLATTLRVARLTHRSRRIVEQPADDGARGPRDPAFHHRQIRPLDGMRGELRLERSLRAGRRGEDEQSGCEPIEPVDDEDPGRRLPGARDFKSSAWVYGGKVFNVDENGATFVVKASLAHCHFNRRS